LPEFFASSSVTQEKKMNTKCTRIALGQVNAYAVMHSKTLLVDTGMPGSWRRIQRVMTKHDIELKSISLIVITHAHEDHIGELKTIHDALKVPVMMHTHAAQRYKAGQQGVLDPSNAMGRFFLRFCKDQISHEAVPVEYEISEEMSLEPFGVAAAVVPTPGHTPGSLSLVLPDNSAIIGDLLMGSFVFPRKPKKPFFATDMQAVRASCEELLARGIERFYPGHGGPFNAQAVARCIGKI
jgi:glyoxylase-like metal-dependent hydrolase (beta-lactamase superfamily II)